MRCSSLQKFFFFLGKKQQQCDVFKYVICSFYTKVLFMCQLYTYTLPFYKIQLKPFKELVGGGKTRQFPKRL